MKELRRFFGKPETHLLMGALFAIAFIWPFVAMDQPLAVFEFLFGLWALAIVVAFGLSRIADAPADGDAKAESAAGEGDV